MYEEDLSKFKDLLVSFDYDKDMQLHMIQTKIQHIMIAFDKETDEEAKKLYSKDIDILNDMYYDIFSSQKKPVFTRPILA